MRENNQNYFKDLDFVRLNETLADPQFANWYYDKVMNGADMNLGIIGFVDILKKYTEGEYK